MIPTVEERILFEWSCTVITKDGVCGAPVRVHRYLEHHTLRYSARSRVSNHLTQRHGNLSVRERSEICDLAIESLSLLPEETASPERPNVVCVCACAASGRSQRDVAALQGSP